MTATLNITNPHSFEQTDFSLECSTEKSSQITMFIARIYQYARTKVSLL